MQICSLLDSRAAELDYAAKRTTALLSATLHARLGSLAALSLKEPAAVGFEYTVSDEGRWKVSQPQVAAAEKQQADRQQGSDGGQVGAGDGAWAAATPEAKGLQQGASGAALEQFEIPAQLRQRFVEVRRAQLLHV
jgi:L-aminopeptidase/D-esterase-like protein